MRRTPEPFLFTGGQRAIILLHAYASSSNDMRMLARRLQKANYTVYAPIFTGHATGDPRDIISQGSAEQWWQDTLEAIAYVRGLGYRQVAIFGLSLGGVFATRALEVDRSLVGGGAFAAPVMLTGTGNIPQTFELMATQTYQALGTDPQQLAERLSWIRSHLPAQLTATRQFTALTAANLSQLTRPFFLAQGDQDEMFDYQAGLAFKAAVPAAVVQFHLYSGAGHVLTVNNAHHQLENDLLDFLPTIFDNED